MPLIAATLLVMVVVTLAWLFPAAPVKDFEGTGLIENGPSIEAGRQLLLYRLLLLATLCTSVIAVFRRDWLRFRFGPVEIAGAISWLVLLLVLITGLFPQMPPASVLPLFAGRYGVVLLPSRLLFIALALASAALVMLVLTLRSSGRWRGPLALSAIVISAVFCIDVAGLVAQLSLAETPPGTLDGVLWHFHAVFGIPYQGATADLQSYSPIVTALLRGMERAGAGLSWRAEIGFLQLSNLLYLALSLAVVVVRWPKQPLFWLLPVICVSPWVHSLHQGIFFPNQAGWRFLGFPAVMLLLLLLPRARGPVLSICCGAMAGWLIVWNAETGIAAAAGLATYTLLRNPATIRSAVQAAGLFAAAIAIGLGIGEGVSRLAGPGVFPYLGFFVARFTNASGYGLPFTLEPVAILIAIAATAALIGGCLAWGAAGASSGAARRAAIGSMILVWGSYYALRPDPWNLWSYTLGFAFLLTEQLHAARRLRGVSSLRALLRPAVPVLVLVLLPSAFGGQIQAAGSLLATITSTVTAGPSLGEVVIRPPDAKKIETLARGLDGDQGIAAVVSGKAYALAKLRPDLAARFFPDPQAAGFDRDRLGRLLDVLRARNGRILVEKPLGLAEGAEPPSGLEAMRKGLASTHTERAGPDGWVVFERK